MRDDEVVSGGSRRGRARRAFTLVRAAAGVAAVAAVVTGVGTAAAGGGSTKAGLITNVTTVAPDNAAAAVLATARKHLGDKYVYGAAGPSTWDCSGFTSWLWRTVGGVSAIPRTARLQQAWATPVPASQVQPGDLYFLGTPATHVGLVVGNGLVLDASASHGHVILRQLWTATDITFGRVPRAGALPVKPGGTPTTPPTTPPTTAPTDRPPTPPSGPSTPVAPPTSSAPPTVAAGHPVGTFFLPSPGSLVRAADSLVGARFGAGATGPRYDDAALFAAAWQRAGGLPLPLDRNALAARAKTVPDAHLRVGDLVVYGAANKVWHVGMYVGKGMMVDASAIRGHVVLRPVFTSPDRRFGRLH